MHFAVIGDSGTGGSDQARVAQRLTAMRSTFPFDIVLMLGDNLYGGSGAARLREQVRSAVQGAARRAT